MEREKGKILAWFAHILKGTAVYPCLRRASDDFVSTDMGDALVSCSVNRKS